MHEDELVDRWHAAERAPVTGWDFTQLGPDFSDADPPWSYLDLVRTAMRLTDSVLDIGTGGGEKLLSLRDAWPARVAATDGYAPNLDLARKRLAPLGAEVADVNESLTCTFPFVEASFGLVIDRHAAFNAAEVTRVLRPGGTFITQQVDGRSHADLMAVFGATPKWPFVTLPFVRGQVEDAGMAIGGARECQCRTAFRSVASLVRFLVSTPWYVDDFSVDRYLSVLLKLQERLVDAGQLSFTCGYVLLTARKPPRNDA